MFTEDTLATAEIAKIFGSELLNVQEKARTDAGMQPHILKMHPKQFLTNQQTVAREKIQEQELIRRLQREAELAHPLPAAIEHSHPTQPELPLLPEKTIPITQNLINPLPSTNHSINNVELTKLNENLDRIATILEKAIELFGQLSDNNSK